MTLACRISSSTFGIIFLGKLCRYSIAGLVAELHLSLDLLTNFDLQFSYCVTHWRSLNTFDFAGVEPLVGYIANRVAIQLKLDGQLPAISNMNRLTLICVLSPRSSQTAGIMPRRARRSICPKLLVFQKK
jgi:hypothetical protein